MIARTDSNIQSVGRLVRPFCVAHGIVIASVGLAREKGTPYPQGVVYLAHKRHGGMPQETRKSCPNTVAISVFSG